MHQSQFNQQFPNNGGFGQNIQSVIPISQYPHSFDGFGSPKLELIKKSITINELIDLLDEKKS